MSVADILERMAENAGRRQQQRGALIGGTIADVSQVPAQILADRERHAILLRQQAQQDAQLGFARNADQRAGRADTRAQADQALQDAAAQREADKRAALKVGVAAGFGDSDDPKDFDLAKASKAVTAIGFPELATTLNDFHTQLLPKLTSGAPGSVMRDASGQVVPGSAIPEKRPDYTINGQRFSGDGTPIGAAVPPPVTHSPALKEWQDYKEQGGTLDFNAYMTADANRKKPTINLSGMNSLYADIDPKAIAAQIRTGDHPPDISQYGRPAAAAIASELAKPGPHGEAPFKLSFAQLDWKATQKHLAALNGAQQLRLNQAITALPDMLDKVDALASRWKGGRFPVLNKANLALAKGGAYGQDVASVATQLDAQIADVTADLGNVYMGGNSPTDHALGLAGKSLKGDWSEAVLHDMVKLAKTNVTIRRNSIANTGVAGASADNPYAAQAPAAPARNRLYYDANGNPVKQP